MAARRDRRIRTVPENIVTESDLQMKELLRKQIDTDVTIDRQVLMDGARARSPIYRIKY